MSNEFDESRFDKQNYWGVGVNPDYEEAPTPSDETKTFAAKYDGICKVCSRAISKGEPIHYTAGVVAHENCHSNEVAASDYNFGHTNTKAPEHNYVVKGRRNHENHCETCGLEHAGEC